MASFPLFVDLKNKECLIIGAGDVALRKLEILLRYDAQIKVIAPNICESILELEKDKKIRIEKRAYAKQDMEEVFLVIAATSSAQTNVQIYEEAKRRNIPVNVVDEPSKCTFFFPSVIKRGDLSIGISTHGKFPALSKKLRKLLAEVVDEEYDEILNCLGDFRQLVRNKVPDQAQRELILKEVIEEFYAQQGITAEALRALLVKYERALL